MSSTTPESFTKTSDDFFPMIALIVTIAVGMATISAGFLAGKHVHVLAAFPVVVAGVYALRLAVRAVVLSARRAIEKDPSRD